MASRRQAPEINASSMADIAFLLLIFFLVTTTIDTDKGLLVKLPEWVPPDEVIEQDFHKRNVLEILVNQYNQLLVNGELQQIENLKAQAKDFIDNNGDRSCTYCEGIGIADRSDNPKKAVVSLKNDRATNYDTYLTVYNELKAAYNELREVASLKKFGKSYKDLSKSSQKEIRQMYPIVISEAEPESYGSNN